MITAAEYQAVIAKAMSEDNLLADIQALATARRWAMCSSSYQR